MTSNARVRLGRRLILVGQSCSGKSTLAAELANRMGCDFIELDALYWKPGWTPSDIPEFRLRVEVETRKESWVVAGNYESVKDITWPRADTVIWLDFSLRVTLPRVLARSYRRWRTDELLWGTNRESFWGQFKIWDMNQSLIRWNLHHRAPMRKRYLDARKNSSNRHLSFHQIRSPIELQMWRDRLDVADPRAQ